MIGLLLDFVDGTLAADAEYEFRTHLCGCPPCCVYLETYETTIRITRALPKDDPLPPEFERRLRAMVEAEAAATPAGG
jgi:anti-sigma factor RsiW